MTAGAAVVFLALVGRSRPWRMHWWKARSKRPPVAAVQVVRLPIADYQRPRWWERFAAATGLGVIAAILGAVLATFVAVSLIWAVQTLTGLLK